MTQNDAAREALALAERLKPMLAGRPPQVQSGVVAELMATYLSGWKGPDRERVRRELFNHFEMLVWQLVSVTDEHDAGAHAEPRAEQEL